jgi:hypothetical protein
MESRPETYYACDDMLKYVTSLEQKIATLEAKLAQGLPVFVVELGGVGQSWRPQKPIYYELQPAENVVERWTSEGFMARIRPALLIVENNLQVISDEGEG